MDIRNLIKKDHDKAKQALKHITSETPAAMRDREKNFDKLCKLLEPHMQAEEDVFYPVLEQEEDSREKAYEAQEEHHVAKMVLGELKNMKIDDEHWLAKAMVFKELVEHHIEEEEGEIFDMCDELFEKDKLNELGKQFQTDEKKVMQTH